MRALRLAVVAVALATAQLAFADTVVLTATLQNVNPTDQGTVSFDSGAHWDSTPYIGKINWSAATLNTTGNPLFNSAFSTFCIEGTQNVYITNSNSFTNVTTDLANTPVGELPTMGATAAADITQFWNLHYADAMASQSNAAAFQLGIWELRYDTGSDTFDASHSDFFTTGKLRATASPSTFGTAMTTATGWLQTFLTATPTAHYQLYALTNASAQDQLIGQPLSGGSPVPLPAALPAGLAMLGALGLLRKVRRN